MYELKNAMQDFLNYCQYEKGLSEKTLKFYQIDLLQFSKFLREKNYSQLVVEINKKEIREYLTHLSSLKPKSIKRKIATIKAMFNFLEYEDTILVNPVRKMRIQIKEPKRLPKVMTSQEIRAIMRVSYNNLLSEPDTTTYAYWTALRDIVVIELLFATGARVSEIATMKMSQLDLKSGAIKIIGKGNKERMLYICNAGTQSLLKDYQRTSLSQIKASGGYFLTNRFGTCLSDQSIRGIVKQLAKKAGIKFHVTPHMFRHSFATLLMERDVNIKYIQSLLGHSSIMTTQIYTHVNRAKQKQILHTKHPRKDFIMPIISVS